MTASVERDEDRGKRSRQVAWALLTGAFLVYLAVGSMPVHAFRVSILNRRIADPHTESVLRVWRVQVNRLPELGSDALLEATFLGAIVLFLVGTAAALWFALVPSEAELIGGSVGNGQTSGESAAAPGQP
jgi:hypothetical protein